MTTVEFGGVTFTNDYASLTGTTAWVFTGIGGWHDGPTTRTDSDARPRAHGDFAGRAFRGGRIVSVEGSVVAATRAVASAAQMSLVAALADGLFGTLTVTDADQGTLTAEAQVYGTPRCAWNASERLLEAQVQLYCPDPFRYGPTVTESTGFAQTLGGLRFPLFTDGTTGTGVLYFGDPGAETGAVTVTNDGTAPAWTLLTVTGPTPAEGFDVLIGGSRLRYSRALGSGAVLTIDTATGQVREGTADRKRYLTVREWASVAPGASAVVQFMSLGGATSGSLSVALAPTYW